MSEADKLKTAFACKYGLWEWNVTPSGLCNAPATFQRLMEYILAGLQWRILALYLDDISIFAKTADEHLQRLRTVFERCRSAGLKLKPGKCDFLRRSVSFFGHVIDENGIHTENVKLHDILR